MKRKENFCSVIIDALDNSSDLYKTARNIFLQEGVLGVTEVIILTHQGIIEDSRRWNVLSPSVEIKFVSFKDFSVNNCRGEYLFFLKSGDYVSLNLFLKFRELKRRKNCVYVPREKIFFGEKSYTHTSLPSSSPDFINLSILESDVWGKSVFISKRDYLKLQTRGEYFVNIKSFYCDILSADMEVSVIPQTISFVRVDSDSMDKYLVPPKKIFNKRSLELSRWDIKKEDNERYKMFGDKFLSSSFPRIHAFLLKQRQKIRNISIKLRDKEDNRIFFKKIAAELFPKFYLNLFILKDRYRDKKRTDFKEDWVQREWEHINIIEPKLYPPASNLHKESPSLLNKKMDTYLYELLSFFPEKVDFLVFSPWLKRGGADKVVISLIKGLKKVFPGKKIGLICTEKASSEILSDIDEDLFFFDFGNSFLDLNYTEKQLLLRRFLIEENPEKVININSHFLFNLLLSSSKELARYSDYYCFCFSPSRTEEGQFAGFSFDYIPFIIDNLKQVITDNQNIINVLSDMFGLDSTKFSVLYQPISCIDIKEIDYTHKKDWNILWASRIDYEKLPDILVKILDKSEGSNMNFHIYGGSVIDKTFNLGKFNKYKNARTYGAYKGGLHAIHAEQYDLFLYTSWFDGMPNTILEAISLGLPVVASNVGGINEIIKDKKTGLLVDDIFNEEAYLRNLREYMKMGNKLNEIRKGAMKKIQNQHSWLKYENTLREIFK